MAGHEPENDLPDDRITCRTCVQWRGGICQAKGRAVVVRLHRCEHYQPNHNDPDKRCGIERWPNLTRS